LLVVRVSIGLLLLVLLLNLQVMPRASHLLIRSQYTNSITITISITLTNSNTNTIRLSVTL